MTVKQRYRTLLGLVLTTSLLAACGHTITPQAQTSRLRLSHAVAGAPAVDLYLTSVDEPPNPQVVRGTPLVAGLEPGRSRRVRVAPGRYIVTVAKAGASVPLYVYANWRGFPQAEGLALGPGDAVDLRLTLADPGLAPENDVPLLTLEARFGGAAATVPLRDDLISYPAAALQEVRLPFIANAAAAELIGSPVADSQVFVGQAAGVAGICQGDSGGPLLAEGEDGPVQVGLTSWSRGCGLPGFGGGFSRVAAFRAFIDATVGSSGGYALAPQVVGGDDAARGAYGFMAALLRPRGEFEAFTCGGSLVAPDWVLTAAHCVDETFLGGPVPDRVLLGATLINPYNVALGQPTPVVEGEVFEIAEVVSHPDYVLGPNEEADILADVALVRLARPAAGYPLASLADAAQDAALTEPRREAVALGLGSTIPRWSR